MLAWFAMLLGLYVFPFQKTKRQPAAENGLPASAGPLAFFGRHKKFTVFLIGLVGIYISHVLINNFALQIITVKGGNSAQMGTAIAIQAVVELPPLIFFAWIHRRLKLGFMMRVAAFFYFAKNLLTLAVSSVEAYYAVQVCQMFAWGITCIALVYYVNEIMEEEDAVKGQAYVTTTNTIAMVIGSLAGGWLIDLSGVQTMMIFSACCGAFGAVLVLLGIRRQSSGIGT